MRHELSFPDSTDALQRLVVELENDSSLTEAGQVRRRLEALDRLDVYFPYAGRRDGTAWSEPELHRRARALCARLEGLNQELYEAIREEIQRGFRPDILLRCVTSSLDIEGDAVKTDNGYDHVDDLISGVFQFEEPGAEHAPREFEKVFYQPTPVRHIFSMMRMTALTASDVFVDLGSGLGHVPLLVSICTDARCVGIETEAAYIECARRCAQRLNVGNVTFIHEDARAADLSTGTVFYFYTPFTGSILMAVLNRLKSEATHRQIRVCSYGPCTSVLSGQSWLEAVTTPGANRITLFRSRL